MPEDVLVVSCEYKEDVSWLDKLPYPHVIYSKTHADDTRRYLPRNVGAEAEAYLQFIIDRYDDLPNTMVFVHGHETSHHQDGTIGDILASLGNVKKYNYASLNNRWVCMVYDLPSAGWYHRRLRTKAATVDDIMLVAKDASQRWRDIDLHTRVLALSGQCLPEYTFTRHCAQFVVSRELVTARPREFWESLLALLYELHDAEGMGRVCTGVLMEVLWFYILTGEHDEWDYVQRGKHLRERHRPK